MPPRKSGASLASNAEDASASTGPNISTPSKAQDGINIEDLSLPRTMVQRLAKGVLPPNTQIQKDAVLAIQKSATVFINYIAAQANVTTQATNRRTIQPKAILEALEECEFSAFIPRVEAEMKKLDEVKTTKRNDYRKKVKDREGGADEEEGTILQIREDEDTSMMLESNNQLHAEEDASAAQYATATNGGSEDLARSKKRPRIRHDGDDQDDHDMDDAEGAGRKVKAGEDDDEATDEERDEDDTEELEDEEDGEDDGDNAEDETLDTRDGDEVDGDRNERRRSGVGPGMGVMAGRRGEAEGVADDDDDNSSGDEGNDDTQIRHSVSSMED